MANAHHIVTVDVLLFTLLGGRLHACLIEREAQPFKGRHALPGTYVRNEDISFEAAARRVLADKVGIRVPYIEQLETFGGPDRDPRGWAASVAHYGLVPIGALAGAKVGANLRMVPAEAPGDLPFDHNLIIERGLERLRGKSTYTVLPAYLLPPTFVLSELHRVYEQVVGARIDSMRFRTNVVEQGLVEATGEMRKPERGAGRPAAVYRVAPRFATRQAFFLGKPGD